MSRVPHHRGRHAAVRVGWILLATFVGALMLGFLLTLGGRA